MTTDADVEYETTTVRAVRGMESRTVKKWEGDGWELVTQTPGKLQTELTFRRPNASLEIANLGGVEAVCGVALDCDCATPRELLLRVVLAQPTSKLPCLTHVDASRAIARKQDVDARHLPFGARE